MSDLNAIRERCKIEAGNGLAFITENLCVEVEALREKLSAYQMWIDGEPKAHYERLETENKALRAKLEKAKEALKDLRANETNGSFRHNGTARLAIIKELLEEMEKP